MSLKIKKGTQCAKGTRTKKEKRKRWARTELEKNLRQHNWECADKTGKGRDGEQANHKRTKTDW